MKATFTMLIICVFSSIAVIGQNNQISYSKNDKVFNLKVKNSDRNTSITIKGDVRLSDDDKSIREISPGGSVAYENDKQSLEVAADRSGNLSYSINGVKKENLTDNDKVFVEMCVQQMINYGIDANNRVRRIFSQKGTTGVLSEVERFKNDYAKEIYLSYLLKNDALNKNEMITLLNKADEYLSSDYYKSKLISGVMPEFLKDDATADDYLKVVSNINSDYYQYTTIGKLLKTSLSEQRFNRVLEIVKNMKSDYYQYEVLKTLLNNNDISDEKFTTVMTIAGNMNSDYFQSQIIMALLKNKSLNKDRYAQAIAAMQNMKGSYYQFQVIEKLINEDLKEESAWSSLIQYASKVDSDYYQSELLQKIAKKMPASETLKKELNEAAKKIKSDYYYGRVVRSTVI